MNPVDDIAVRQSGKFLSGNSMKQLTVKELIELLSKFDPDLLVYTWAAGNRDPVYSVDDGFVDEGFIDINAGDS